MEKEYAKRILVTGGLGFIGSHIVRHLVNEYKDWFIINMDCVTYAGNPANLDDLEGKENYVWYVGDIRNESSVEWVFDKYGITHVAIQTTSDLSSKLQEDENWKVIYSDIFWNLYENVKKEALD